MKLNRTIPGLLILLPSLAFAADEASQSIFTKLFVAVFPVLLIIVVFTFFIKIAKKDTKCMQEKMIDSNLEIAKQLKRIADKLDNDKS